MASDVDITNLALSHLGELAEVIAINPNDGSAQAQLAGRFYPMARDELLEMHDWSFARRRVALSLLVTNEAEGVWLYAYGLPSDCLKDRAVYPTPSAVGGVGDQPGEEYEIETTAGGSKVLYTNCDKAVLRYTRALTDTTRFTPMFVAALARLLASKMAGPIIKGTTGMTVAKEHMRLFLVELGIAKTDDSNSGKRDSLYRDRLPSAARARGYSTGSTDGR